MFLNAYVSKMLLRAHGVFEFVWLYTFLNVFDVRYLVACDVRTNSVIRLLLVTSFNAFLCLSLVVVTVLISLGSSCLSMPNKIKLVLLCFCTGCYQYKSLR